jgi:hypothetical protein
MKLVDEHDEGNPKRWWPLTHKELRSFFGLVNYYHHFHDFVKVVRTLSDLLENGYPKIGMSFVTKPLESLRVSCFRHPYSNSRNLTNLLRCIQGRV